VALAFTSLGLLVDSVAFTINGALTCSSTVGRITLLSGDAGIVFDALASASSSLLSTLASVIEADIIGGVGSTLMSAAGLSRLCLTSPMLATGDLVALIPIALDPVSNIYAVGATIADLVADSASTAAIQRGQVGA
jgi:hypothetical protein